jgi:predicted dehydrogenase
LVRQGLIRIGIVGSNYGSAVLLPAFRLDSRCRIVAIAGSRMERTADIAREAGIPNPCADWEAVVDHDDVDAVVIATPPDLQPAVAAAALKSGKPVFLEKPMAADLTGAEMLLQYANTAPSMVDFGFSEILAWKKAKAMLDAGAIGSLRQVNVSWLVENAATRLRLKHWKNESGSGGGALGNLASHSLHYLEWFGGPITGLSARLSGLPDDPEFQVNVSLAAAYKSGAAIHFSLSCAAFAGSGHRIEFHGDEGTLVLNNSTIDYMRGFTLVHARRPDATLVPVAIDADPVDQQFPQDGRIAPVSRLAGRFLDAIEAGSQPKPGLREGHRVHNSRGPGHRSGPNRAIIQRRMH